MQQVVDLYRSSIGKKVVMAVTGAVLVLYVIAHMLGNLKIYQGPEKINSYGHFLREVGYPVLGHGEFLWIARIVLLAIVVLHIVAAYQVSVMSLRARDVAYKRRESIASNYASRTMRWSGVILGAFIVFHILHLTTGDAHPKFEEGEVFQNMVIGFQQWGASLFYIIANLLLGLHLFHGIWSGFQTLGISNPRHHQWRRTVAAVIAIAVTAGNISIPLAVLGGIVP